MDPNATLNEIRRLMRIHESEGLGSSTMDELIEHIRAFDEWLCRGGFYPTDWQPHSRWEAGIRTRV